MPLTSVASLPASPSMRRWRRRCSTPGCRCRRPPFISSVPLAPTRRSLPSPPSSVSSLSAPVRTSSPPSPVELRAGDLGVLREHGERVVAVAAVDVDAEGAVGRHGLVAGRGAVPVRAAVQPAGRLPVDEQAAGDRHGDVVVGAVEVECRRRAVDRRRADRGVRRGRRWPREPAASAASQRGDGASCVSCREPS